MNEKTSMKRFFKSLTANKTLFILGLTASLFLSVVMVLPPLVGQFAIALTAGYGNTHASEASVKSIAALDKIPFVSSFVNKNIDPKKLTEDIILRKKKISRKFILIIAFSAVVILLRVLLDFTRTFVMSYLAHKSLLDIRGKMLKSISHAPLKFFRDGKDGELLSRIQSDAYILEEFVIRTIPSILNDPIVVLLTLIFLLVFNWKLTLVSLALAPFLAFLIISVGKYIGRLVHSLQDRVADYTVIMQELLSGIETVKIFSKEETEYQKFKKTAKDYLKTDVKILSAEALSRPATEFFAMSSLLGIVTYGGYLISTGQMSFEFLWGFILFLLNISQPVSGISKIVVNYQKAKTAASRVFEIIDTPSELEGEENLRELEVENGSVEFKNVSFKYDRGDNFELGPISLKASKGEVVALVGPSGSGKTTIVSLIPKLIFPSAGEVLIDSQNISYAKTTSVRQSIAMISQHDVLFYGTIMENILYGKLEATEEEVYEAAKMANAHSFIEGMPKGYNTEIGNKGSSISGGQKQRIILARALIKKPRILIMDEATSALDTESEQCIQDALDKILHRQTTFVIAHRLSTVKNANLICVVENGKIIEQGRHSELIEGDGKYAKLYSLQFR